MEVEPRVSLPCAAWKRDTVDLTATLAGVGVDASGRSRSCRGPGVGGGDKNATFFCASAVDVPLAVLRELRPVDSDEPSGRRADESSDGGAGSGAGGFSLVSTAGSEGFGATGVVVRDDSVEDEGSPMGGNGRAERSGRGLYEWTELGVDVARWGGQSGRGGSWGIFSLGSSFSLSSLSLPPPARPRFKRVRKAFMGEQPASPSRQLDERTDRRRLRGAGGRRSVETARVSPPTAQRRRPCHTVSHSVTPSHPLSCALPRVSSVHHRPPPPWPSPSAPPTRPSTYLSSSIPFDTMSSISPSATTAQLMVPASGLAHNACPCISPTPSSPGPHLPPPPPAHPRRGLLN